MIAICPAGPPKLMKPSLSQKAKADQKATGAGASSWFMRSILPATDDSVRPTWRIQPVWRASAGTLLAD